MKLPALVAVSGATPRIGEASPSNAAQMLKMVVGFKCCWHVSNASPQENIHGTADWVASAELAMLLYFELQGCRDQATNHTSYTYTLVALSQDVSGGVGGSKYLLRKYWKRWDYCIVVLLKTVVNCSVDGRDSSKPDLKWSFGSSPPLEHTGHGPMSRHRDIGRLWPAQHRLGRPMAG